MDRYVAEALKIQKAALLYILLKDGLCYGTCTVDLSTNTNYFYGLAISELERGKAMKLTSSEAAHENEPRLRCA